jgi:mannose-6-phosphate isomerase-like protein (cupin superfamily)
MIDKNEFEGIGFIPKENLVFVKKGWGWEEWLWNSSKYCGKKLFIEKDKQCSFHYHHVKDEVFCIIHGDLLVTYGYSHDKSEASQITLSPGDVFHVPPGLVHQMKSLSDRGTLFHEFSSQHFDSDSIRIEKGD